MSAIYKACNIYVNVNHSSMPLLGSIALDTIETSHEAGASAWRVYTYAAPSIIEVFETKDCWDQ